MGPVVLLTDRPPPRTIAGLEVEDFSKWFVGTEFKGFLEQSAFDQDFRKGFWSMTLLRLFVLSQYMRRKKLEKIAHAELDVLIFLNQKVISQLDSHGSGLFVPWIPSKTAIASFMYTNDSASFERFIEFVMAHPGYLNEMQLLHGFLSEHPESAYGLPTVDAIFEPTESFKLPVNQLSEATVGGLFDAARLGQWVFGIDPRNVKSFFRLNQYSERDVLHHGPMAPKVTSERSSGVRLEVFGKTRTVFNLHIHSKTLFIAANPVLRSWHFLLAGLPFRSVVGVRSRPCTGMLTRSPRVTSVMSKIVRGLVAGVRHPKWGMVFRGARQLRRRFVFRAR